MQTAGFEITISSNNYGPFRHNVKYIVNEKFNFEF